ncbi:glucoamylase family protein [Methylocella sp.]|uniref:glucoamylase family protein n=1 Tax=Methylocella sp. TaxID=1978226 RepID=UPI003784CC76
MTKGASSPPLEDEALLDAVQRATFRYFWDGAHPVSFLARDRLPFAADAQADANENKISIGGSGFGAMALVVGAARGWVGRSEAARRLMTMVSFLERTPSYHGMFPHYLDGRTGATIPMGRKDDGGDLVETALLFQGLLCARRFFDRDDPLETDLRNHVTWLWQDVEWSFHAPHGRKVLLWHWSPNNGFSLNAEIRGWNECLIAYVLAAAAPNPRFAIDPILYHEGFAQSRSFLNRRVWRGHELPLGPDWGGPLFFAHYSFCGLNPHGLSDRYADYFEQNVRHCLVNYAHCVANPGGYAGYGPDCWGLTASDDALHNYAAHAPDNDLGVISPTAALSSFPYLPQEAARALRHFHDDLGAWIFGRYGFADAFSEAHGWRADSYLAIDQGPIVAMIENHRSGLLWRLFMSDPDVRRGLARLDFRFPPQAGA